VSARTDNEIITAPPAKRIVTAWRLMTLTGSKRAIGAADIDYAASSSEGARSFRYLEWKVAIATPSRSQNRDTVSPESPERASRRSHAAAFRGSDCRPINRLFSNGIFDHLPEAFPA